MQYLKISKKLQKKEKERRIKRKNRKKRRREEKKNELYLLFILIDNELIWSIKWGKIDRSSYKWISKIKITLNWSHLRLNISSKKEYE